MDMNTTGEYGYNYALSTKTSDVSLNDLLGIRCMFVNQVLNKVETMLLDEDMAGVSV
jgi:hypothetical protein